MSRTVLAVVVAVVIAALTGIAYFVTSTRIDEQVRHEADERFRNADALLPKLSELEAIDIQNKAERLASKPAFLQALQSPDATRRGTVADMEFDKFIHDKAEGDTPPDLIALVAKNGTVVAMNEGGEASPNIVPKQWKLNPADDNSKSVIPAIDVVLGTRKVLISDIWEDKEKRLIKIGVAPIIDPSGAPPASDMGGVDIEGAIVVGYAQTSKKAVADSGELGADVAYFDGTRIVATTLDTDKQKQLEDVITDKDKGAALRDTNHHLAQKLVLGGVEYDIAPLVSLPRKSTKALEKDYPAVTAGEMVLEPIQSDGTLLPKMMVLLVGLGALAIGLLGMYLTHRRVVTQVDAVEMGVIDIINGNVDRTFRPVGDELDGLANGLNVMLSRLLGRPEPGDEEFDDDGNPIVPGRVDFEDAADQPSKTDPDLAALAQESEPDYYKRVFTEYQAARKAVGNPDDGSFENFIAKLKVNEGKLKAQHQCRAVRFRVVTKDNKVTLKPVPIFA
jgi:hypothetical protein|nr:MXAN_5187 C-terminal domain-containing protein [Kofleriaceae bacterium]